IGECVCSGDAVELTTLPAPFSAVLAKTPLTFSQPLDESSAATMLHQNPRAAVPWLTLTGLPASSNEQIAPADARWKWYPRPDLLESQSLDQHMVVEIDND